MNRSKLKLSLAAALITIASATHLAKPAGAATPDLNPCSGETWGYAYGYSEAYCGARGYTASFVSSCQNNTFLFSCYDS
jgi:hypothetical protein